MKYIFHPLSVDEKFLLADLKEHRVQSSWDWSADERFAIHLGERNTLIRETMDSGAPAVFRMAAANTWKKITQRRLRTLRRLVDRKLVTSFWSGTGDGGFYEFGVRRIRSYALKDE
jgi:hypothetical protein